MVVNPQAFNYRLIIGTLIVALLGLSVYSISSYKELKDQKEFLVHEKKIVENEISKIISRYDELMGQNDELTSDLNIARERTSKILDSLKLQEASVFIIAKYRKQIQELQNERLRFVEIANALKEENSQLKKEKFTVVKRLQEQTENNTSLSERNLLLAENLKKGAFITANSFQAKAFRVRSSGKIVETNRAKRTEAIEVCFTLAENALAESGNKDLYIQILNPNSNIIGDKLSKSFGDYSLIFSTRTVVNYDKQVLDVCVQAKAGEEERVFTKGTYYVNVFHNEKKLGGTQVVLN